MQAYIVFSKMGFAYKHICLYIQINKKFGQDISTLIVEVKASKDVEAAVHEKIEQMTGQVTTLSNEMKRITTTIGKF